MDFDVRQANGLRFMSVGQETRSAERVLLAGTGTYNHKRRCTFVRQLAKNMRDLRDAEFERLFEEHGGAPPDAKKRRYSDRTVKNIIVSMPETVAIQLQANSVVVMLTKPRSQLWAECTPDAILSMAQEVRAMAAESATAAPGGA